MATRCFEYLEMVFLKILATKCKLGWFSLQPSQTMMALKGGLMTKPIIVVKISCSVSDLLIGLLLQLSSYSKICFYVLGAFNKDVKSPRNSFSVFSK